VEDSGLRGMGSGWLYLAIAGLQRASLSSSNAEVHRSLPPLFMVEVSKKIQTFYVSNGDPFSCKLMCPLFLTMFVSCCNDLGVFEMLS
jgi:hypothetical protein